MDLVGGPWFKGKSNLNWTFATNTSGIVFGEPSVPQAQDASSGIGNIPFNVTNHTLPNRVDITMGDLGDYTIEWLVVQSNGTDVPESAYTALGSKGNGTFNKEASNPSLFELQVYGYGVCPYPTEGNTDCGTGNIDATIENWNAFQVDKFLSNWTSKYNGNFGSNGMMEQFKSDFGINTDQCTAQQGCSEMQACNAQNNPGDANAPAVFLAYNAMANVSPLYAKASWSVQVINKTNSLVVSFTLCIATF